MRTEIPAFQRCCVCLPLRCGLIIWGYCRLALAALVLAGISSELSRYREPSKSEEEKERYKTPNVVILSLLILVLIADIILGIIFIVGCHKKNTSLLERYYQHSLVLLALLIPLCIYNFGFTLYHLFKYSSLHIANLIFLIVPELVASFSYVLIQIYVVLLVRSEILKLKNEYQFRFENKITEAECFLSVEDTIEGTVTADYKETIDNDD